MVAPTSRQIILSSRDVIFVSSAASHVLALVASGASLKGQIAGQNHKYARKSSLVKMHGRAPQGWKRDEETAALIVDRSSATTGLCLDGQHANHSPKAARYVVLEYGEVRVGSI